MGFPLLVFPGSEVYQAHGDKKDSQSVLQIVSGSLLLVPLAHRSI